MDVRLPDGTVIANVPEGTTKADLMARVQKMPGINFQQLQAQTQNRRAIEAQIANDPISTGAQDVANEGVLPAWLAGKPGATYPERVAAAPMTRFAVGAAAPVIGGMQLLRNMGGADNAQVGPFSNPSIQQLEEMKRAGGADGFDAMGLAGNILSPVGLKVAKTLKPAASVAGRAAQGAAIGTGFGASAPVTNGGENYWSDKAVQTGVGGAIGVGIPLALDLSVAGANALRHGYRGAIEPFFQKGRDMAEGRKYVSTAGERAQEMANALRNPTSSVPGYNPTTAEVAASLPASLSQAGREEMAGLQANVSQNYPRRIPVEQGQNKALVDSIRGITSGEGFDNPVMPAMRAAELVRGANADPLYGAAGKQVLPINNTSFQTLMQRPNMEKAITRAQELAAEKGTPFSIGKDVFGQLKPLTVDNMQMIKMGLDDLAKNPERFGIGASEQKAILGTKEAFTTWLEKESPTWAKARGTYAGDSFPIDQMKIGNALEEKLTSALQGDTKLNPTQFASSLRESANIPQKSTGAPRYTRLEDALRPQNMQTVNNVSDTLANRALAADLGRAGSSRAAELTGTPDIILPPTLSHTGMALRFAARLLQGQGTSRMDQEMARDMLTNPQRVSKLMEDAMSRAKTTKEMVNVMRKYSPLTTQGAVTATGEQQ